MWGDLTVAAIAMIGGEILAAGVIAGLLINHLRHRHLHHLEGAGAKVH